MIGPLLLIIGLLGIWALARGKAGPVLDAIIQTGFSTSLENSLGNLDISGTSSSNGPDSGSSVAGHTGNQAVDSGSHMGIDPATGLVVTIDKSIAQMTDTEKDAANAFARAFPGGLPSA